MYTIPQKIFRLHKLGLRHRYPTHAHRIQPTRNSILFKGIASKAVAIVASTITVVAAQLMCISTLFEAIFDIIAVLDAKGNHKPKYKRKERA